MAQTIDLVDGGIDFLLTNGKEGSNRDRVVLDAQAWQVATTEEGKEFIKKNASTQPLGSNSLKDV